MRTSEHKNQWKDIHVVFKVSLQRSLLHHKGGNAGKTQADNSGPVSHCLTNYKTKILADRLYVCSVEVSWEILVSHPCCVFTKRLKIDQIT